MRRIALAAAACFLLADAPAWGHANFRRPGNAPANADTALIMDVPNERDEANHNVKVVIAMPDDVQAKSCQAEAPWQCRLISAAGSAPAQVEWTREREAPPNDWDESFRFTAFTGPAGVKYFKTIQTYHHTSSGSHGGTGVEVAWIGTSQESGFPAARLTVGDGTATTTTTPAGATTTTAVSATTTTGAAGATTTTTRAPAATTTTRPPEQASTTTTRAGGSPSGATTTTSAAAARASAGSSTRAVTVAQPALDPGPLASTGPAPHLGLLLAGGATLAFAGSMIQRSWAGRR